MRIARSLFLCVLTTALPLSQARHARGEGQTQAAERYAAWAKEHPAHDSTGLVPLPDLGTATYKGERVGLYLNGANTSPAAHLKAGVVPANKIAPPDSDGQLSSAGRIALITTGMSNTRQESRSFDGAECAKYWSAPVQRVGEAGVTSRQVQAAWLREAGAMPKEPFPIEVKKLQQPGYAKN